MDVVEGIIPHIPSKNMRETIQFMVDVFGFESVSDTDAYAELRSGQHVLGILPSQGEPAQQSLYLRVKDVDAFWANIGDKLHVAHHKPPFNQAYGMREIHLVIPATNTLLFVGSPIRA